MICLPLLTEWRQQQQQQQGQKTTAKSSSGFCSVPFGYVRYFVAGVVVVLFFLFCALLFAFPLARIQFMTANWFFYLIIYHMHYTLGQLFPFAVPPNTKHLLLPHLLPTSCAVNAKPWELNMSFWLCVEWHYSIIYHICTKLACCWHCLWFRCCK